MLNGDKVDVDEDSQAPRCMLAAASTPKVLARADDNLGFIVRWAIENEVRLLLRHGIETEVEEESIRKTGTLQCLQELLGNNHVRIDILHV